MRLKIKLLGLMFFLGGFLNHIIAQNISIIGKVKNKTTGDALVGATVSIEKTTKSTLSDASGNFSITVQQGNVLVISYVGYITEKRKVTKGENLTILLEENPNKLDEVVVIGYGKLKFSKISGSVSTVKSDLIEKLKPVRTEDALQGTASGVTVVQNGTPGSKPTVLIRGIASYGGNSPLVVIDGIPQTQDDLNALSPSDIESISVLKDAALTAIYGVSGGNGVILVTTKSGRKNQKTEINLNTNYGIQEVQKKLGVLNGSEYAAMINEGSTLAGGNIIFSDLSKVGVGTNWQDQIFKTAVNQNHSISVKGGSEKTNYYFGGSYTSQGGIVAGEDKSNFKRGVLTANISTEITNKLKFTFNNQLSILSSKAIAENSFNSILGSAINYDPTVPVLNDVPNTIGQNGFSKLLFSEIYNPTTKLDNTYNKNNGFKLAGKIDLQYDILKDLKLTTRFGYQKYDDNSKSFNPLAFYGLNNVDNSLNGDGSTVAGKHNSVSHNKNSNFNYTFEAFANYSFKIKEDHHFEAVAGFSLQRTSGNAAGTTRQDVPFNSWTFADYTAATGTNNAVITDGITGYYYEYFGKKSSGFGRINYDYKDKYLVSFNGRNDGSNLFGANNKFGFFTSGSIGWVVSKENFFNVKAIDLLKLRASTGETGNDQSTRAFFVKVETGGPSYGPTGNSNGYTFGDVFYPGATVASLRNDNVIWETNKQTNIGFDLVLLKNKFAVTFDYYTKQAKGLLFEDATAGYLGTLPRPSANIGTTKTSGIDLQITYNQKIGNSIKLTNLFNITTVKNEVTATNTAGTANIPGGYYFNGQPQNVTFFEKGYAPGHFVGYKTAGLFQNAAEVAASPTQEGAVAGDIKFVDVNGDKKIDAKDKTDIGNPFPKLILGWNFGFEYKNIDVGVFTYASIGNDLYRAYERNGNYTNKERSILARWTGEGTTNNAKTPRYSFLDANSNIRVSDRYVEDGSFVKIKNIQLGYTLPTPLIKKVFSKVRIYAQVRNAFTFTKYSGFDPELGGGVLDTGIDRGAYPQARTYAFGLDIKL